MRRLPAIVCDIDGVLVRGSLPIGNSPNVIPYIRQPLKNFQNAKIPFICLTNGGGKLELDKAEQLNQLLNLKQTTDYPFESSDILLNFTPLRPIMKEFQDKPVLIIGSGEIEKIAQSAGLQKYVTLDEFCNMYPHLIAVNKRERENPDKVKKRVLQRFEADGNSNQQQSFHTQLFKTQKPLQMHAIFVLNDVQYWEDAIQIICDLCSTPNGKISRKVQNHKTHIPIFTLLHNVQTNSKFYKQIIVIYADEFQLPRFAFGAFTQALKYIYHEIYKKVPEIIEYGKPTLNTYDFAEKYIRQKYKTIEISNFYMIGDNPKSDIRGANQKGWNSILVRSGIFTGENDQQDPAKYVVEDFQEAIKLICQKEELPFNL